MHSSHKMPRAQLQCTCLAHCPDMSPAPSISSIRWSPHQQNIYTLLTKLFISSDKLVYDNLNGALNWAHNKQCVLHDSWPSYMYVYKLSHVCKTIFIFNIENGWPCRYIHGTWNSPLLACKLQILLPFPIITTKVHCIIIHFGAKIQPKHEYSQEKVYVYNIVNQRLSYSSYNYNYGSLTRSTQCNVWVGVWAVLHAVP